jgi:hypothetical protein
MHGRVEFADLYALVAAQYALTAHAPPLAPVSTSAFDVRPSAAASLGWVLRSEAGRGDAACLDQTQPDSLLRRRAVVRNATAGVPLGPDVCAAVYDVYGNALTTFRGSVEAVLLRESLPEATSVRCTRPLCLRHPRVAEPPASCGQERCTHGRGGTAGRVLRRPRQHA